MLRQQGQVFPAIPGGFAGRGGLDVHHPHHSRIHPANIQRTAGFQRHVISGIAQGRQQGQAIFLRQRFTARNSDVAWRILGDLFENFSEGFILSTRKGIDGVAIATTQRTPGQPDKHRRQTDAAGLTLQGEKYFADAQLRL